MKTQCLQCESEIISEGKKPKKYCSDKCRKAYLRNGHLETDKTDTILETDTEETDKPYPTLTPEQLARAAETDEDVIRRYETYINFKKEEPDDGFVPNWLSLILDEM